MDVAHEPTNGRVINVVLTVSEWVAMATDEVEGTGDPTPFGVGHYPVKGVVGVEAVKAFARAQPNPRSEGGGFQCPPQKQVS